ncbi:hypothetical protein THAOC_06111 [Thalassiosira oceanica]|uniref:Uncharacterized protein n=1 Tax=Thalassiosira oceanica TaxID=159749 RepID=K0T155_THAOC|nr:hypothetical protein THAOC_06111 [Thalassiosira oceanica]|eukprot:EJK72363.1 hypothetical protein THAOC_06111 [Thalassiosira oceanica]
MPGRGIRRGPLPVRTTDGAPERGTAAWAGRPPGQGRGGGERLRARRDDRSDSTEPGESSRRPETSGGETPQIPEPGLRSPQGRVACRREGREDGFGRAGGVNARASQPEGRAPAAGGTDGPGERVELPVWRAQGEVFVWSSRVLKDERPTRGVPVPEVRAGRPTAVGSETVETKSPLLGGGFEKRCRETCRELRWSYTCRGQERRT